MSKVQEEIADIVIEQPFIDAEQVWKNNSVGEFLTIPFKIWCEISQDFIKNSTIEEILGVYDLIAKSGVSNIRFVYFEVCVSELIALQSINETGYEQKRKALVLFCEKALAFLREYYQEHIIMQAPALLPQYAQVALCLRQGLELEKTNVKKALEMLTKVVEIDPDWGATIQSYMGAIATEEERKEREAKDELKRLRIQVMEEVKRLTDESKYDDALTVVGQLKKMKPNDLEILALSLNVRLEMLKAQKEEKDGK